MHWSKLYQTSLKQDTAVETSITLCNRFLSMGPNMGNSLKCTSRWDMKSIFRWSWHNISCSYRTLSLEAAIVASGHRRMYLLKSLQKYFFRLKMRHEAGMTGRWSYRLIVNIETCNRFAEERIRLEQEIWFC